MVIGRGRHAMFILFAGERIERHRIYEQRQYAMSAAALPRTAALSQDEMARCCPLRLSTTSHVRRPAAHGDEHAAAEPPSAHHVGTSPVHRRRHASRVIMQTKHTWYNRHAITATAKRMLYVVAARLLPAQAGYHGAIHRSHMRHGTPTLRAYVQRAAGRTGRENRVSYASGVTVQRDIAYAHRRILLHTHAAARHEPDSRARIRGTHRNGGRRPARLQHGRNTYAVHGDT
ncbi:hypothetical protein TNCT_58831 [Trichonephila clavata]|uniref:Uncharacterized protein n=1 Tax=Trichonephila clavata TaxID=2740835 RepID=A0A8X6HTM2_TRICU|nr:hypothetical protein TNCT_58831 [Trichonephila clavata]